MQFREFLLNEDHTFLGQKVGDVLNALHDLQENGQGMGTRLLIHVSETIVQQIRQILHTHWDKSEAKYLPRLQKVGVAIMKAIDGKNKEKEDLQQVLGAATQEIEKLMADLGTPQNTLGSPPTPPEEKGSTGVQPTVGKDSQKQQTEAPKGSQSNLASA